MQLHPKSPRFIIATVDPKGDKDEPAAFVSKINLRAATLGAAALLDVNLLVRSDSDQVTPRNQAVLAALKGWLAKSRPTRLRVFVQASSHGFHGQIQQVVRAYSAAVPCQVFVEAYFGRDNLKGMTPEEAQGWQELATPGLATSTFTDHNRFAFFSGNSQGFNLGRLCPTLVKRAPAAFRDACEIYTTLFTGMTLKPSGKNMLDDKKLPAGLKRQDFVAEFQPLYDEALRTNDLRDYCRAVLASAFRPALPAYKFEILDAIAEGRFEGPACDILIPLSEVLAREGLAERYEGKWTREDGFTKVDRESAEGPRAAQYRLTCDLAQGGARIEDLLMQSIKVV
jgi:hypothetical protein